MGQKYAIFSKEGLPQGFYDKEIHGENIPQEAIEITEEQWKEFVENQGLRKWNFNTKKVVKYTPTISLNDLKDIKKQEIKQAFINIITNSSMTSTILNVEVNFGTEHLANVQNLINYLEDNELTTTQFRTYDNTFIEINLDQLKSLEKEMITYAIQLREKKWELEQQIDSATAKGDLQDITVDSLTITN